MTTEPKRIREVPKSQARRGVYVLPNLLTTAGLLSGIYSLVACLRGDFFVAGLAIIAANVFDIFDGRVARVTKTETEFGSQYDSLADLVAFGVAPGILMFRFGLEPWGTLGWTAAGLYVICGALRLARFNVQRDDVGKRNFVGLPIPAAAEVIATSVLLYLYVFGTSPELAGASGRRFGWLLLTYAAAVLMVSGFRYFSFKELDLGSRQPFSVLLAAIILLMVFLAEPQFFLFVAAVSYAASGPVRSILSRVGGPPAGKSDLTAQQDSSSVSQS